MFKIILEPVLALTIVPSKVILLPEFALRLSFALELFDKDMSLYVPPVRVSETPCLLSVNSTSLLTALIVIAAPEEYIAPPAPFVSLLLKLESVIVSAFDVYIAPPPESPVAFEKLLIKSPLIPLVIVPVLYIAPPAVPEVFSINLPVIDAIVATLLMAPPVVIAVLLTKSAAIMPIVDEFILLIAPPDV